MSDSLDNLNWFYQHYTGVCYLLETDVPMYDVANFIMEYIIRLEILFVSNKVKADLMMDISVFNKSKSKLIALYVEPIAILLMQLIRDDNFSVCKLKALHESTIVTAEQHPMWILTIKLKHQPPLLLCLGTSKILY